MAIEPTGNRGIFRVTYEPAMICPKHVWRNGLEAVRDAVSRNVSFDVPHDFTIFDRADCRGKHREYRNSV